MKKKKTTEVDASLEAAGNKSGVLTYVALHILLLFLSLSGVCSKKAGMQEFLSLEFCIYFGLMVLILGIYTIGWQQIIKRIPLTTAFCNKAVNVIWGMLWGYLIFDETIKLSMVLGGMLVIIGVVLVVTDHE